jgi:hypothetical protein
MTSEVSETSLDRTASWCERIAEGMALAATPLFAVMALASLADNGDAMLCGGTPGGMLPGGMALMYALMSFIHAGHWLRRMGRI